MDDIARAAFSEWLRAKLGVSAVTLGEATRPSAGGLSSETVIISADWGDGQRGLVLRLPPIGKGLFPSYDFAMQVSVVDALKSDGVVPVSSVLWHETDDHVLGREFIVMDHIEGQIPSDNPDYRRSGWLKELPAEAQRHLFDDTISTLAAIHRIDIVGTGLDTVLRGTGLEAEFTYWMNYLEWAADGERFDAVEAAFEWCVANRPATEPEPALVWGDTRLGNIIYDTDFKVRAVLDWEMAMIGAPELDLGWYLFLERTALQFAPQLDGFPDREGTIKQYETHLGRQVVDIDFYEIWGGFRSAAIMIRVASNFAELGLVPKEFRGANPVTQLLTKMIS